MNRSMKQGASKWNNDARGIKTIVVGTIPTEVAESEAPKQLREPVVIYDADVLPQSEAICMEKRFKAARLMVESELEMLKSKAFERFDAIANNEALENVIKACQRAQKVLTKAACVALALLMLGGCCGDHDKALAGVPTSGTQVNQRPVCADGHCDAR